MDTVVQFVPTAYKRLQSIGSTRIVRRFDVKLNLAVIQGYIYIDVM